MKVLCLILVIAGVLLPNPGWADSPDVFRVRHPGRAHAIGHVPRSGSSVEVPPLRGPRSVRSTPGEEGRGTILPRIRAPELGRARTVDYDVRRSPAYRILVGSLRGLDLGGLFVRILRVDAPDGFNPVLAEGYLGEDGSFELGPVPSRWLSSGTVRLRPVVYLKTSRLAGSIFSGGLPEKIYRLKGPAVRLRVKQRAFRLRLGTLRINSSPLQKRLVRRFTRYVRNRDRTGSSVRPRRIKPFSGSESVLLPLIGPRSSRSENGGDTTP